jgi:hypothetical protein
MPVERRAGHPKPGADAAERQPLHTFLADRGEGGCNQRTLEVAVMVGAAPLSLRFRWHAGTIHFSC